MSLLTHGLRRSPARVNEPNGSLKHPDGGASFEGIPRSFRMSLPAGARLGPYEILDLVGAGGMGEVYRARDPRLGRDVAIKVLPAEVGADPGRLRRFEQEARAVAALNHPNIL